MKVLCSAVLGIEAIVVFLASLVASTNGSVASQGTAIGLGAGLALVLVASIGVVRRACEPPRPYGLWWGSAMQVVVVAIGLWVPAMFIVGGIFAVLWIVSVRNGGRVDAMRRASQPE
ncbi:MAG: DUF4233 domain-containing protein [Actinomycetales bacterium]|nr:DUF4233 domain-containing protein [Actinomycetales bacterium]